MSYATLTDLQTAFGAAEILQLADRDHSGAIDTGVVEAVLARADSLIDGYLSGRYALPLSAPYPKALLACAADLARYWLYDDAAPERVRDAYEDTIAWLRDVAAGKVYLQLPSANAAPTLGSPVGEVLERLFSRETLASF